MPQSLTNLKQRRHLEGAITPSHPKETNATERSPGLKFTPQAPTSPSLQETITPKALTN
jgi:hypothetical protein